MGRAPQFFQGGRTLLKVGAGRFTVELCTVVQGHMGLSQNHGPMVFPVPGNFEFLSLKKFKIHKIANSVSLES